MKKQTILEEYRLIISLCFILLSGSFAIAQCNANFTFTLGTNGTATFASTSTGTSSNTIYFWSTGNGTYGPWGPNLTHSYFDNETYSVTLTITDASAVPSCSSSITKTLGVTSVPCFTNVTIYDYLSANGLVSFSGYPLGSSAGGYTFSWAFGDGGTSNLQAPNHTYTTSGIYNVTLTASSYSSVCTYTTIKTASVTVAPCNVSAAYTYTVGTNGLVHFKTTSTGTVAGMLYNWNFHDNLLSAVSSYSYDTISRRFSGNVTYPVNHSAFYTNPFYCKDSISQMISITNVTACSAFSYLNLQKDTTQSLTWNILASYPSNLTSVTWNWGDNTSSTGLYPSHTYSAAGWYSICTTVSVSCGSTYSTCNTKHLYRPSVSNETESMITVNVKKLSETIVGIESLVREPIKASIWPNPNNGNFDIKIETIEPNHSFDLKIYNLLGQTIYKEKLKSETNALNKTVNLNDFPAGTYFLQLESKNDSYFTKIIITK